VFREWRYPVSVATTAWTATAVGRSFLIVICLSRAGFDGHSLRVPAAHLLLIAEAEVADICVD